MISDLPFSFTAHAMDIFKERLNTKSLRKKIRSAKFVVTVSEYNRKHLSELAESDAEKIVKIHNGINLERFCPEFQSKTPPFKFICVARFVEKKGHPVLIEACEILRDKGFEYECWLVGKGKLRGQINKLIKSKKLQKKVLLLGAHSQHEVVERYKKAHAYVLPCICGSDGNRDGLPVSIVEALASGLPVITTPMTGNPEVVRHENNGILVPFHDPQALAEAMGRLIKEDSYYEQLRKNTRASVEKQFNIHRTVQDLADLFSESFQ
jgi:glycosyltransferase involved in cell wall biosynthesis